MDTLLRMNEDPAELTGYGPIPAQVARELASDAQWRRWVTDPVHGHLLDYGRSTYRPRQELVEYLIARDNSCTFPGCGVPAWRCDIDHTNTWSEGGETAAWCMGAVCRSDHNHRTHGGWKVTRDKLGLLRWISPLGRIHNVLPRQVLPTFTGDPPGSGSGSSDNPDPPPDVEPEPPPKITTKYPDEPPF
jgi:hypothetical protein